MDLVFDRLVVLRCCGVVVLRCYVLWSCGFVCVVLICVGIGVGVVVVVVVVVIVVVVDIVLFIVVL